MRGTSIPSPWPPPPSPRSLPTGSPPSPGGGGGGGAVGAEGPFDGNPEAARPAAHVPHRQLRQRGGGGHAQGPCLCVRGGERTDHRPRCGPAPLPGSQGLTGASISRDTRTADRCLPPEGPGGGAPAGHGRGAPPASRGPAAPPSPPSPVTHRGKQMARPTQPALTPLPALGSGSGSPHPGACRHQPMDRRNFSRRQPGRCPSHHIPPHGGCWGRIPPPLPSRQSGHASVSGRGIRTLGLTVKVQP